MLRIEIHQTRESCFSGSEDPLCALFANSKCVFFCLHWGEDWVWPHRHKAQIGGVLQRCLSFCRFSYLHIWSLSSTRVTIGFFITTLTKALLYQLLSLARRPALRRTWLLPLSVTETTCFVTLQWSRFFSELFPRSVAWRKPVSEHYRQFFWPHYQLLDLLLRRVCLSKSYPFNWICHRLPSVKV